MPKLPSPSLPTPLSAETYTDTQIEPSFQRAEQTLIKFSRSQASPTPSVYTKIADISLQNRHSIALNFLFIKEFIVFISNNTNATQVEDLLALLQQYQTHPEAQNLSDIAKYRNILLISKERFEEAFRLANNLPTSSSRLATLSDLGNLVYAKNNLVAAQQCFEACLELIKAEQNIRAPLLSKIEIYSTLAIIYKDMPNSRPLCVEYCLKVIEYIHKFAEAKDHHLSLKDMLIYIDVNHLLIEHYSDTEPNAQAIITHCSQVIHNIIILLKEPQNPILLTSNVDIQKLHTYRYCAYIMLGIATLQQRSQGDIATAHMKAEQYFESAQVSKPYAEAQHALGLSLLSRAKYHGALNAFLNAFDKGFETAAWGLAACYIHLEQFLEASSWLNFLQKYGSSPAAAENNMIKILYSFTGKVISNSLFPSNNEPPHFQELEQQIQQYLEKQSSEATTSTSLSSLQKTTIQHIFNKKAELIKIHSLFSVLNHSLFDGKFTLEKTPDGFSITMLQSVDQLSTSASTSAIFPLQINQVPEQDLLNNLARILSDSGILPLVQKHHDKKKTKISFRRV